MNLVHPLTDLASLSLALWDQLLEGRIKLQKALLTANQLPQPETFPAFKMMGGAEMAGALKNSKCPDLFSSSKWSRSTV